MKTLITFFESFMINWQVIWSDASIYVCLWLIAMCLIVVWAAKNYRNSIREEYLVKTTSARIKWDDEIERVKSENRFLHDAFAEYRTDAQNEAFERQTRINDLELNLTAAIQRYENAEMKLISRRNPDGTFAKTTGKGHGRKKPAPAEQTHDRDWTTATPNELLAEAKRRYPVGTRILSIDYETNEEIHVCDEVRFNGRIKTDIYAYTSGSYTPYRSVYLNGQWAQILS